MADLSAKLHRHIGDGESRLIDLCGMCSAAIVLAEDVLGGKPGGFVSETAREGLYVVINNIVDQVEDLQSWLSKLHELGVVRGGEKADG